MKILIPIISLGKFGGIKVLSNLANYWTKQGHEVTIIIPSKQKIYYPLNCKVVNLTNTESVTRLKTFFLFFKYIKKNSLYFDAIIANHNATTYPILLASKTKNIYYIQAYEPEFYDEIKNNILKKYVQKFIAWFSYFLPFTQIVNSNMYISYKNIKTTHVIYPGINLDIYFPKERNPKKSSDTFRIGCIGRKEEWKGSEDVAEAIKILHNKGYKNIEFIVAFNAVSYDNHTLVHPDGDGKLADYYRSLDILITPGHIQLDAIHYPVIEAMATKTSLITTGYFPSNESNSFLVPIKSPEEIAKKIIYVINNYDEAITKSKKAYELVEQFSWEKLSQKFISIVEDKN